jgi:NADH-quinone oxidoreductase subunit D
MYCFRERERILDLFEMLCGARITLTYMRPGGVLQDTPDDFWPALDSFINNTPAYIDELESLISGNEIVLTRTREVGILNDVDAIDFSISGPMLRAAGVEWDLRKADPYEIYDRMDFDIPIGALGDTFDRYIVRIQEMRESIRIIRQCVRDIPRGQ